MITIEDVDDECYYLNKLNEAEAKIERLEKKLAIATKALEQYANCKPTEWMTCVTAQKALKDIKEVK